MVYYYNVRVYNILLLSCSGVRAQCLSLSLCLYIYIYIMCSTYIHASDRKCFIKHCSFASCPARQLHSVCSCSVSHIPVLTAAPEYRVMCDVWCTTVIEYYEMRKFVSSPAAIAGDRKFWLNYIILLYYIYTVIRYRTTQSI